MKKNRECSEYSVSFSCRTMLSVRVSITTKTEDIEQNCQHACSQLYKNILFCYFFFPGQYHKM